MLSNESDNHRNFHEKVWGTFRFSLDLALFQEFLMCIQGFNGNSLAENGVYIDQIAKKLCLLHGVQDGTFKNIFCLSVYFLSFAQSNRISNRIYVSNQWIPYFLWFWLCFSLLIEIGLFTSRDSQNAGYPMWSRENWAQHRSFNINRSRRKGILITAGFWSRLDPRPWSPERRSQSNRNILWFPGKSEIFLHPFIESLGFTGKNSAAFMKLQ